MGNNPETLQDYIKKLEDKAKVLESIALEGLAVIEKLNRVHQHKDTPIGISECTEAFRIKLEKIIHPWKFSSRKLIF